MNPSFIVLFLLPSLRISGGNLEVVRLAAELRLRGTDARIISLWKHPNSIQSTDVPDISTIPIIYLSQLIPCKPRTPFDLLILMLRYRKYIKQLRIKIGSKSCAVVLTHYSTLLFAWLTPPEQRYCFLQGEEWRFVTRGPLQYVFRRAILFLYAHCQIITANMYLTTQIQSAGLKPVAETSIWANMDYATYLPTSERSIDLVMVLRKGYIKRLDLYMQLIATAKLSMGLTCAVITPEENIAKKVSDLVDICLLQPSREEMKALYQRSKVFVLFSEREGFGLPPLEAMGSGCVPFCRDSGGVRCYMTGALAQNLISLDAPFKEIQQRLYTLFADREELLRLSAKAQEIFMAGAKESAEKRQRSLSFLSFV